MNVDTSGAMNMIMLEDQDSVNQNGIIVGVIDMVVTYGPHVDEFIGEKADEETRKNALIGAGRGGLTNTGGEIESERFRTFKNAQAYEGIATTNILNVKAKVICCVKAHHLLFVIMLVDAHNFDTQAASYEAILDKDLKVQ